MSHAVDLTAGSPGVRRLTPEPPRAMYRWKNLSASFELPSFRVRHQFTPHLRDRQHKGSRGKNANLLSAVSRGPMESGDAVSFRGMPIRAFGL